MKNKLIKGRHRDMFYTLVNDRIPNTISAMSGPVLDNYDLTFESFPINVEDSINRDSTIYTLVKSQVCLTNTNNGDSIGCVVDVLKLPIYQEQGFYIRGNYMQSIDVYKKTPGWVFSRSEKHGVVIYEGVLNSVKSGMVSIVYNKGRNVNIVFNKPSHTQTVPVAVFMKALFGSKGEDLIETLGNDNPYIVQAFTSERNTDKFYKQYAKNKDSSSKAYNLDRSDCIDEVYKITNIKDKDRIRPTIHQKLTMIKDSIMSERYFNLGKGNSHRIDTMQSFKQRAFGKVLAEDINIEGVEVKAGVILDETILDKLDRIELDELPVMLNNKIYRLKKFSTFTFRALGSILAEDIEGIKAGTTLTESELDTLNSSSLTSIKVRTNIGDRIIVRRISANVLEEDDLLTALSIFFDNLNGFDAYDRIYELTNKVSLPYSDNAIQCLEDNLNIVKNEIKDFLEVSGEGASLVDALSRSWLKLDINTFISNISINTDKSGSGSVESQRSDMNNPIANITKDFRTSNVDTKRSTEEEIRVQDHQLGRTDPLDSPESSSIGLTHVITLLARNNENGELETPYLRIKNGKVVSEEPVYLTASQEYGKFIAAWNETYLDEKGNPKKRVLAKRNGEVISTDIDTISYQQYSQLAEMSPARSCIPFQEHCMMKRLLMGNNHQKQANASVRGVRPRIGAGGESIIDAGRHTAESILTIFINNHKSMFPIIAINEQNILNSKIRIIDTSIESTGRILRFSIDFLQQLESKEDFPKECQLMLPYHLPTDEKTSYSYDINTTNGNEFQGKDIVAHHSAYDLGKYEVIKHLNYGALKYDDDIFENASATGVRLIVAMKTFESSTIDDACVINSKIVYDDTLTTINSIKVVKELFSTSDITEKFGLLQDGIDNSSLRHIGPDGLPKIGTVLKPGDVYCNIISTSLVEQDGKPTVKNKPVLLGPYQEGQVTEAVILEKDGKEFVQVSLASRSIAEEGDKMSGRHGNKGVIGRVVPEEQMPYSPELNLTADIILSPLGVPSRMNIGVPIEIAASEAFRRKGHNVVSVISPFTGNDMEFVMKYIEEQDVKPVAMIDGRTGKYFERPVMMGEIYMYMLVHKVKKKIHAVGFDGGVDSVTLQPKQGAKANGGQAFGEMETWVLQSIGANKVADELFSSHSDDVLAIKELEQSLLNNEKRSDVKGENNNNFMVTAMNTCLGVDTVLKDNIQIFKPLLDDKIRSLAYTSIKSESELHSEAFFGSTVSQNRYLNSHLNRDKWGWIDLGFKMVHPTWIEKGSLGYYLTNKETRLNRYGNLIEVTVQSSTSILKEIADGKFYVNTKDEEGELATGPFTVYASEPKYMYGSSTMKKTSSFEESLAREKEMYDKEEFDYIDDEADSFSEEDVFYHTAETTKGKPPKYKCLSNMPSEVKANCITGMTAVVWLLENYDINYSIIVAEDKYLKSNKALDELGANKEDRDYSTVMANLKVLNELVAFSKSSVKLKDFVISSYPVLPTIYRPDMSGVGIRDMADFDWYYKNILVQVNKHKVNKSEENALAVYDAVKIFCGYSKEQGGTSKKKFKNLLNWFVGKGNGDDKGKLRTSLQSKRIFASGRSVIIPMANMDWSPCVLGVPYSIALKMFGSGIIGHLNSNIKARYLEKDDAEFSISKGTWSKIFTALGSNNKTSFKRNYSRIKKFMRPVLGIENENGKATIEEVNNAFILISKWIEDYVNGNKELGLEPQVVIAGRQPSLHEFSIRAYYAKIVYGKAFHIHALVCKGYNADFDGDTIWCAGLFGKEAIEEALSLMLPKYGYINPKNSSVILDMSQDIVLGLYCLTMLKDNKITIEDNAIENVHHYNSIARLQEDIMEMELSTYEYVCLNFEGRSYLSTAGRILFNYLIGGLTTEPFENTLGFTGIKKELYCNLKYDALITGGKGTKGKFAYKSSSEVLKELYEEHGDNAIDYYQIITKVGFKVSDIHSVTLSVQDFMLKSRKDLIIEASKVTKEIIEEQFAMGLFNAEDKKRALINLYSKKLDEDSLEDEIYTEVAEVESRYADPNSEECKQELIKVFSKITYGINYFVNKEVIDALHRNNNLFIMMDSGARGNPSQIMIACGSLGVLQKTNSDTLETAITANYFEGLSGYDSFLGSFSTRTAVAATQNETQKAGEATRAAVYMTSGLTVVEEDCGKRDWWYNFNWDKRLPEYDKLIANSKWLYQNLDGMMNNGSPELDQFTDSNGFITIDPDSEITMEVSKLKIMNPETRVGVMVKIDPNSMKGSYLLDDKLVMETKKLTKNGVINSAVIKYLLDNKIKRVKTSTGEYNFRYAIYKGDRSLLARREARNAPSLKHVGDKTYGKPYNIITSKTLDYMEEHGVEGIEARVFVDCNSKDGICAHCYGMSYTSPDLPEIGEAVGIESAQSLGESSAQLTMDTGHRMGQAGSSATSGVVVFKSALQGNIKVASALLAPVSGYVNIKKLDARSLISIEVPDISRCADCKRCALKNKLDVGKCIVRGSSTEGIPAPSCVVETKVDSANIIVQHGQWVYKGDPLTYGLVHPDDITSVKGNADPKLIMRRKQMELLGHYFDTFENNNVSINARHFESLVRMQNFLVTILESDDPNYNVGELVEYSEIIDNDKVKFSSKISSRKEVLLRYGGPFTLLTHSDYAKNLSTLGKSNYRFDRNTSKSKIGKLTIGESFSEDKPKDISIKRIIRNVNSLGEDTNVAYEVAEIPYSVIQEEKVQEALEMEELGLEDIFGMDMFEESEAFGGNITPNEEEIKTSEFNVDKYKEVLNDEIILEEEFYEESLLDEELDIDLDTEEPEQELMDLDLELDLDEEEIQEEVLEKDNSSDLLKLRNSSAF